MFYIRDKIKNHTTMSLRSIQLKLKEYKWSEDFLDPITSKTTWLSSRWANTFDHRLGTVQRIQLVDKCDHRATIPTLISNRSFADWIFPWFPMLEVLELDLEFMKFPSGFVAIGW